MYKMTYVPKLNSYIIERIKATNHFIDKKKITDEVTMYKNNCMWVCNDKQKLIAFSEIDKQEKIEKAKMKLELTEGRKVVVK